MKNVYVQTSAQISQDGIFRYCLERTWDVSLPKLVCVGVNPSTATAEVEDPTIRKVVAFAKRWGYGGIVMVNLYTFRATDAADMKRALREKGERYVIGETNDQMLVTVFAMYEDIWFAWGAHAKAHRGEAVMALARACRREPFCIGVNQDGSPLHPLMAAYKCERRPWALPVAA